ncbi:MAG TPA: methylmalonate-semialdehyde dehydrogenase (CoA acylating), partial [Deltaproteobacteria bacterium]|nr:methylmalonate-semialdehyde dehydrogenase (CoA acylating) [Deltaproteobacteria bacterium]
MNTLVENYINGARKASIGGSTQDIFNPATGEAIAQVTMSTATDVNTAVQAAKEAFPAWRDTPPVKRARVMFAFNQVLQANTDKIAETLTREHGKTFEDAKGEVIRGIEVVEFACGIPQLLKGTFNEQIATGVDAHSVRQPLGVVAGITPFNFPAMVPM